MPVAFARIEPDGHVRRFSLCLPAHGWDVEKVGGNGARVKRASRSMLEIRELTAGN